MKHLLVLIIVSFCLAAAPILGSGQGSESKEQQKIRAEQGAQGSVVAAPVRPIFRSITAAEAVELIKTREDLQVIDVRTPQERHQFRIANTELVEVGDVIRGVFQSDPNRPIMLLCAVGGRSYIAGKVMSARGYREVYNLDGGIESWRRAGFPLETGPENSPQVQ